MKCLLFSTCFLGLLGVTSYGAVTLVNGQYYEDFNDALDLNAWSISQYNGSDTLGLASYQDGGYSHVTYGTTAANGVITGVAPNGVELGTVLPAAIAPTSYASHGFSGSWLTNTLGGVGDAGDLNSIRTATLNLNGLGAHEQIDSIRFLIGAGDSIDNNEGIFEVRLDGVLQLRLDFEGGGSLRDSGFIAGYEEVGRSSVTALAVSKNMLGSGFYRETWNAGEQRAEGWTLDSAYEVNLTNLVHSADAMQLEFRWIALESSYTDEFIAIDNLSINVPEPSRSLLFGASLLMFLGWRRR